ncbi:hypothetical protein Fmac_002365 [Flemingia macrophylla]|uniref:Uncharacterized protein n=1 Tax=Flemingia macrophylla TaxID=520843 RepID=A0ABD1NMJ3_9FABA
MEPASADSSSQPQPTSPPVSNTEENHSTKGSGQLGNAQTEEHNPTEVSRQIDNAQIEEHHSTKESAQIDNAQTEEHYSTEVSGQIGNAQTEEHNPTKVSGQIDNAQTEEHYSTKVSGEIGNAQTEEHNPARVSEQTDNAQTEEHYSTKVSGQIGNANESPPASGISSWARHLKLPLVAAQQNSQTENTGMSAFARITSGLGFRMPSNEAAAAAQVNSGAEQPNLIESFTKGLMDSSKSAVKAVQVKARHIVSQNKRRYQEDGFDLDMTYITENIIAMGFPGGDFSSGIFGYIEGFYRNHMEEVIKFFETHHKVASFPFSDHNCPPIELIASFCQSAYSWLKEDIQNVVVVHCKAGMGRTGLMICSLLLFLKASDDNQLQRLWNFFPTAEEAIDYFNHKRCVDGKALVLPSQIPEDFWISAPKKGIVVFALPGEPGIAELVGDFKIQFHDRQGDFYCWMNTTMTENRQILDGSDFDGFDKRKIPSPGFKVEVVMIDYDGTLPARTTANPASKGSDRNRSNSLPGPKPTTYDSSESKIPKNDDDVFSDSDEEETPRDTQGKKASTEYKFTAPHQISEATTDHVGLLAHKTNQISLQHEERTQNHASEESATDKLHSVHAGNNSTNMGSVGASEIKAIAADASVFSFGDEDFESD